MDKPLVTQKCSPIKKTHIRFTLVMNLRKPNPTPATRPPRDDECPDTNEQPVHLSERRNADENIPESTQFGNKVQSSGGHD